MVATKVGKLGAELLNLGKTKVTKKMKESVRSNPHNLQSVRSYVRSMQNAYEKSS